MPRKPRGAFCLFDRRSRNVRYVRERPELAAKSKLVARCPNLIKMTRAEIIIAVAVVVLTAYAALAFGGLLEALSPKPW